MTCLKRLMCIIVLLAAALAGTAEAAPTVLFDNSHGERFLVDGEGPLQLSGLAGVIRSAGANVVAGNGALSDASLKGVDALVISGAFQPLSPEERDAVIRFMNNGGKLAVMLHIAPPLQEFLGQLGIRYTNGVVRENNDVIDGEALNFRVRRFGEHPVFRGIKSFSAYGAWGLQGVAHTRAVAVTSPQAWVDVEGDMVQRPEETAAFEIAVAGEIGKGGFIIFGDDAIFQNRFLDEDNKALAANLAAWLKSGTASRGTAGASANGAASF